MQPARKFVWPLVAAVAIAGGSYFGTLSLTHSTASAESSTAQPAQEPSQQTVAPANDLSRAFRSVHNALKDAVVNIQIVKKASAEAGGRMRLRLPEGFQLPPGFNPDDLNPDEGNGGSGGGEIQGTGSGVIVSPDGYILTNNHVVEDATDIEVRLDDGRNLKAKVIGTDPKTDLAVVKVEADHLTYAKFGDSDAIEVGDWVLAFGSPLGFSQTMTQGIISAKDRQIDIIASHNQNLRGLTYEDFLQTDAAINPGNSGGPLVNLKGEVVGINAAIASNTGFYNGIGFSIPSNEAKYIMDSLIQHGKVIRGFLNVQIEDVNNPAPQDQALADAIKKNGFSGKGALVSGVGPDGPAAKGGVQSGDVITALNGKPIDSVNQLRNQIARNAPGTQITLTVFRDGKSMDLKFPLGTQPATSAIASANEGTADSPVAVNDLGIQVRPVDAATAKRLHVSAGKGVVVAQVDPTGAGARHGLQPGDVITSVNRNEVSSPEDFTNALSKSKVANGVRITYRSRDGMDRMMYFQDK